MRPEFPGAVPEIPVKDIATAAAYDQDSLGFTLVFSPPCSEYSSESSRTRW